ncbi:MAG: hypothetical protein C0484_17745 [Rhodospirillum sp.]|nr:hypothetical protein [Rhodospirillum sp.]
MGRNECYLVDNNWDDYGFQTKATLVYFDEAGKRFEIGPVKILQAGMTGGAVPLPQSPFEQLPDDYCSLGQNQSYYESVTEINYDERVSLLSSLKDVIWDNARYAAFEKEKGFGTSLMREVASTSIQKFRDIVSQQTQLTRYHFVYTFPDAKRTEMDFRVVPNADPPTNIHVIIGRNGVGKTYLLTAISTLLRDGCSELNFGEFGRLEFRNEQQISRSSASDEFANLITVAFSAFDDFEPPSPQAGTKTGISYSYLGLRRSKPSKGERAAPKDPSDLCDEFVASTLTCIRSSRRSRWVAAMEALETDPVFANIQMTQLIQHDVGDVKSKAAELFNKSSSGHKIVLLTITRLVELVSERTLILIDEPEAHLHPPLAASFIRALSDLLVNRNGVAVLATHSPVMLQEVPKDCVWMLYREKRSVGAERPQVETFAENFGVLTREVFRLEVTSSGYHAKIAAVAAECTNIEQVVSRFGGHLGAEGRAIARSLLARNKR